MSLRPSNSPQEVSIPKYVHKDVLKSYLSSKDWDRAGELTKSNICLMSWKVRDPLPAGGEREKPAEPQPSPEPSSAVTLSQW